MNLKNASSRRFFFCWTFLSSSSSKGDGREFVFEGLLPNVVPGRVGIDRRFNNPSAVSRTRHAVADERTTSGVSMVLWLRLGGDMLYCYWIVLLHLPLLVRFCFLPCGACVRACGWAVPSRLIYDCLSATLLWFFFLQLRILPARDAKAKGCPFVRWVVVWFGWDVNEESSLVWSV